MARRLAGLAVTALLVLSASALAGPVSATGTHHGSLFWGTSSQPDLALTYSVLDGVSAGSADDVWAVGFSETETGVQTLTEHWDGSSWAVVPSPNPAGASTSVLTAVDAISPNNVWAVGDFHLGAGNARTLVEHWNGTEWRRVPSPNPSTTGFGSRLT